MNEHREVRVTARKSVRQIFVAPELSPVRLVDQELEKGTKGWTDFDNKVPDLRGEHLPQGFAESQLDALKVGTTIIRKPQPKRYVVKGSRYGI